MPRAPGLWILFCLLFPEFAFALTSVDALRYRPVGRPARPSLDVGFSYLAPTQDEADVTKNFRENRYRAEMRLPLSDNNVGSFTITPKFRSFEIRTDGKLTGGAGFAPVVETPIAARYFQAGMAMEYVLRSSSGSMYGFNMETLSSSDRLFKTDTISFDSTLFYRSGAGAGNLVYLLDWSNSRLILKGIPLPGFAYVIDPSPTISLMVGFPVISFEARATKDFRARFKFFPSKTLTADFVYSLSETEWLRLGGDWDFHVFFRNNRADTSLATVLMEKRLSFDLVASVLPSFFVKIGGGYVFGREMFESKNILTTPATQLRIEPTIFGSAVGVLEL